MSRSRPVDTCPLCGRICSLTLHHFIPRKLHRRTHFKKHYTPEQRQCGVLICRQCHNGIHDHYDEMELAKSFQTIKALQSDEDLQRHFRWVAKQKVH